MPEYQIFVASEIIAGPQRGFPCWQKHRSTRRRRWPISRQLERRGRLWKVVALPGVLIEKPVALVVRFCVFALSLIRAVEACTILSTGPVVRWCVISAPRPCSSTLQRLADTKRNKVERLRQLQLARTALSPAFQPGSGCNVEIMEHVWCISKPV